MEGGIGQFGEGGEKSGRAEGEERRGFARTFIDVEFAEEDGFNHGERV